MIKILSIDGGGIRGIIPALLLAEIERKTGRRCAQLFDMLAGTSTGGIIALMLALPDTRGNPKYSAAQVAELYTSLGETVFRRGIGQFILSLGNLIDSKYSAYPLERELAAYLGDARLCDALCEMLIPAYDTVSASPVFFKSRHAKSPWRAEENPLMREVARATSAAPTYFPPMAMGDLCLVDGGIFANDPAVCAYAEAKKLYPHEKILLVSLGTGEHHEALPCHKIKQWGLLEWAPPLFGIASNGASRTVNYQLEALLPAENYHRFQVSIDERSSKMDDAARDNILRLRAYAQREIEANRAQLDRLCAMLV